MHIFTIGNLQDGAANTEGIGIGGNYIGHLFTTGSEMSNNADGMHIRCRRV